MLIVDNLESLEIASKVSHFIKGSHVEQYILNNTPMYKVVQNDPGQMQVFSIRLPKHLITFIKKKSKQTKVSHGEIVRQLIEKNLIESK